jgi:acetyl-CoA carboxylase alpha subunit
LEPFPKIIAKIMEIGRYLTSAATLTNPWVSTPIGRGTGAVHINMGPAEDIVLIERVTKNFPF